jgi:DNA-binding beta-propeller fold protein YncE
VDIGQITPQLSTTVPITNVSSSPTGIVFDPAVGTGTQNPGLFFVNSSGGNVITSFNPDNGATGGTSVGINPTALAVNPQTGALLTSNFAGKSTSIVDTLSNPLKTVNTFGLPGSQQFGVAIDQFTNLAVIVDQLHNRVLLFPMPEWKRQLYSVVCVGGAERAGRAPTGLSGFWPGLIFRSNFSVIAKFEFHAT